MNSIFNKVLCPSHIEYLVVDQHFKILETSLRVQRFADPPNEVINGKTVHVAFPELIGMESILFAILQGQQASFDLKGIGRYSAHEDLLYFDLYVSKNPYDDGGESQLIIFFEDVTERMALEQTLVQRSNEASLLLDAWAASRDYIEKAIEAIADAIFVTTSSGTIKTVNKAVLELFEYSEEELVGEPISIILSADKSLLVASQQPLLFQGFLNNVEVICQTKTEKKIVISFSCSAIQTEIEELQDLIYIGRDVTEYQPTQKHLPNQSTTTCTDLRGADLRGADLRGADLRGAQLENARFGDNPGITEATKSELIGQGVIFEDSPLGDR